MNQVYVTTSWDDGHKLDLKVATLLRKYGLQGTFYISPETHEFPHEERLNKQEILSISKDFEIGAHTMTHPRLSKLDDTQTTAEVRNSKEYLENIVGKKIDGFCYPYGDFSSRTANIVKEAGFQYARSVKRFETVSRDRYSLNVTADTFSHARNGITKVVKLSGWRFWRVLKLWKWDNLAIELFDKTYIEGGTFHLFGHARDIEKHNEWDKLERVFQHIQKRTNVTHITNSQIIVPKKKLLISTPYFKPQYGGLEKYSYNITKGLIDTQDWEVIVVTSGNLSSDIVIDDVDGIKVYRLPISRKISNTPVGYHWLRQLKQIIRDEKPDIINAHAPVAGMLDFTALAAGKIPLVVTYHMGTMIKGDSKYDILIKIYEKFVVGHALRKAQHIICSSEYVRRGFLGKYFHKTSVITPGVVAAPYSKPFTAKSVQILHIGGLKNAESHKNLTVSLNAIALLSKSESNITLTVVGEGDQIDEYKLFAEQMNIAHLVRFVGKKFGEALDKIYRETDIKISPTSKESFGMSLLEAMSHGKIVIATNTGGVPHLITDCETGYLIEKPDAKILADKIIECIQNKELSTKIGLNAYAAATNSFGWTERIHTTNKLLSTIVQSAPNNQPKLMITTPYYPPKAGGLENYAAQLAHHLSAESGWDVLVVTSNHSDSGNTYDIVDGIRVYRLASKIKVANTQLNPMWPLRMAKIIRHEKPSIINGHTPVPGIADNSAFACGNIPFVLTYHAATIYKEKQKLFNVMITLYRILEFPMLLKSKMIIYVTPYHKDWMARIIKTKTVVVSNAINAKDITKAIAGDKRDSIIFVNNLNKGHSWKGLSEIFQAISYYSTHFDKNIILDVLGGGDMFEAYRELAKSLKIKNYVNFHGEVTGVKKLAMIRKSRAIIAYPTTEQDAFPTVILEGWASGTPVIAAKIGALTHIINDRINGLLVQPHDPIGLAGAIHELLNDKVLEVRISTNSLRKVRDFTWEVKAKETNQLFRKLL